MTWPEVFRWAQEAADDVRAEVKALSDKLATNDFPHVETRIERGLAEARGDRGAMEARLGGRIERGEARIGERLDRAGQDRKNMEARLRGDAARDGGPDSGGGSASAGHGRPRSLQLGRSPMTWPGWGEVLPTLAALLASLGAVIGGMVALARLASPLNARGGQGSGQRRARRGQGGSQSAGREAGNQRFPPCRGPDPGGGSAAAGHGRPRSLKHAWWRRRPPPGRIPPDPYPSGAHDRPLEAILEP